MYLFKSGFGFVWQGLMPFALEILSKISNESAPE